MKYLMRLSSLFISLRRIHPLNSPFDSYNGRMRRTSIHKNGSLQSSFSTFSTLLHPSYDIVIVGGGLVGASLATALAEDQATRNLRILLLEPAPPVFFTKSSTLPVEPINFPSIPSLRVSSITPSSSRFLNSIGVWSFLPPDRVTPFKDMKVWHTNERGRIHWKANEFDRDELGWIIENDVLTYAIYKRLAQQIEEIKQMNEKSTSNDYKLESDNKGGVQVMTHVKVERIENEPFEESINSDVNESKIEPQPTLLTSSWPRIHLSNGSQLRCRLLIGSDGGNSLVKQFSGISSIGWDYHQRAVVATIKTSTPHSTAWQRFLPTGPVACLPCHDNYSNIVWSTTINHAKHLCSITNKQFCDDLNSAFRAPIEEFSPGGKPSFLESILSSQSSSNHYSPSSSHLSSFTSLLPILVPYSPPLVPPVAVEACGQRMFFPLRFIQALSYFSPRICLIGDAAHVIHPLAGQGVNLGFADVQSLVHHLSRTIQHGGDIGSIHLGLQSYQNERIKQVSKMMVGVDYLQRIFTSPHPQSSFNVVRGIGMDAFNSIPIFKQAAAREAMGID